uniref:Transmembrane phosphatase with tensin homology n=1 Tax=Scophthalmus maximus TaxID=52904 RepID=A0A8D3C438_SCOMX
MEDAKVEIDDGKDESVLPDTMYQYVGTALCTTPDSEAHSPALTYITLLPPFAAISARRLHLLLCPLDFGECFSGSLGEMVGAMMMMMMVMMVMTILFSSSIFGVILIFVDIVLVIVDLSLPSKSREVGDALEAVSLTISFFFLADVLLRVYVSENKRRYQKDGFDLDLTYVTDRVIAMSFPSSGKQSFYRNPIGEVARFLDAKHDGHYKVYNLCSEKGYDPQFFHYRVERVFIDDHNVPSLEDMLKYTSSVREWMSAHPKNIIAIHCKGGKGRTGTLVCTWLIDSDQFESAQDSLEYFGERRTDKSRSSKFQGVETPSQSRYVGYYEIMKTRFNRQLPPSKLLGIKSIRIHSIAGVGKGDGSDLRVKIIVKKELVFQCICAKQENCTVKNHHFIN